MSELSALDRAHSAIESRGTKCRFLSGIYEVAVALTVDADTSRRCRLHQQALAVDAPTKYSLKTTGLFLLVSTLEARGSSSSQ